MELSTFALIIGIIELAVGISLLANGKETVRFFIGLIRNEQFARVFGVILVIICVLVLQDGYAVDTTVPGILHFFAWAGLIKGILYTWWPDAITDFAENFIDNISIRPYISVATVIIGVLFLKASTLV